MIKVLLALGAVAIIFVSACADDAKRQAEQPQDGGGDPRLDWMNGGEDTPEFSLGRLLISGANAPELMIVDLDTSTVAGSLPFSSRAHVRAGGSGRYAYAYDRAGSLRVVDPGNWLLSHIDHFHIMRGEHALLSEQVSLPSISSLHAHEGWMTAYSQDSGKAVFFQERSITANSFDPSHVDLLPSQEAGVALVSRAQLIASDGSELSQRATSSSSHVLARFAGCSQAQAIAAHRERLFVGCAEGLLQLAWDAEQELFIPQLTPIAAAQIMEIRTTDRFDGALLQLGPGTLAILGATPAELRRVELESELVAFELRRQGATALLLTKDGLAHELDLENASLTRSKSVLAPIGESADLHIALSHAYAYITDPGASRVVVLRLRTMEREDDLPLPFVPFDIAVVGIPASYTDDRE